MARTHAGWSRGGSRHSIFRERAGRVAVLAKGSTKGTYHLMLGSRSKKKGKMAVYRAPRTFRSARFAMRVGNSYIG